MASSSESESYLQERVRILDEEKAMFLGHRITLTETESAVDKLLLEKKVNELTLGYKNSTDFLPSLHFFQAKKQIDQSEVFSIIRKIPKGASLHTHLAAAVSVDFIINNFSYREHLYGGYVNEVFKLKFFKELPQNDGCEWTEIKEMRQKQTAPVFDQWLKEQLLLNVEKPKEAYPSLESIWKKFKKMFMTTYDLLSYRPVFEDYIYKVLQEIYDDNIFFTELKGTFMPLYELDGSSYTKKQFFEIFIETVNRFKANYPQFEGVRYIHSIYRGIKKEGLQAELKEIVNLKKIFPDFIIGIDFVGFEEEGFLVDFHSEVLEAQKHLKLFFHAGETSWFGHVDLNLIDAILLNSCRIGHGFAITKHPQLLEMARKRNIALEICPISNQVLMLNQDPRNHPATSLMATDYPLVICNDDPSAWDATGLSYDWYIVFMAMTSRNCGLQVLKQLAINSITYSATEKDDKHKLMQKWEKQWSNFLDDILKSKNSEI